jgi:hypothetical protein
MSFPVAISDDKLNFLSGMKYAANVYLLVWGGLNVEKQIVMKAQINQSQPTGSFSELIFDQTNAAFDKGSDTDALEGYWIFLSETTDIRDSYWSGRLRTDASPTTLFVELTEVEFADDDFIFILKDVRFATRHPLEVDGVPFIDVDIPFQQPPPAISGIKTAYFGKILDSVGSYDLVVNPAATVITSGAAISTWTLDLSEGTQIAFNSSTGAATIRYDTPGFYLPRWTVIDDNGNPQWFTPHVFIDDENLSSAVNLSIRGGSFKYNVADGASGSIPVFADLQNLLDRTFVAVYVDSVPDVGGSNIVFVGQIRTETAQHDFDVDHANINTSILQLEGIGIQMSKQRNFSWLFENKASPATFYELKDATVWRVIASYLLFMTNVNNIHGLSFQDTSDQYLFREFPVEQSYVLTALENIMFTINAMFDYSLPGEIKLVRNAIFMNTSERNALTTVANWNVEHYYAKGQAGKLWSLDRSHTLRVGKIVAGGGFYNSTSNDVGLLVANVPGVVAAGGAEFNEINSQILTADQSKDDAKIEFAQRAADGFAAQQDITTLSPEISDVMVTQIAPSVSQWHTHTISPSDNIRGFDFDANTRWLFTDMSLNINVADGRLLVTPTFQEETSDLGYGVIITEPPDPVRYNQPVIPLPSSVLNLNETPGLKLPTGFSLGVDEQPLKESDMAHAEAKDPTITAQVEASTSGQWGLTWTETQVFVIENLGLGTPKYTDITPLPLPGGHVIKEVVWDRFAPSLVGAYAIANNGNLSDPDTRVYHNLSATNLAGWTEATLTDMLATVVRPTGRDAVITYGKFEEFVSGASVISLLGDSIFGGPSGNGQGALFRYTFTTDPHVGATLNPGVYDSGNDWFYDGNVEASNGGKACDIAWPIPPGVTITRVVANLRIKRSAGPGEKDVHLLIDDVSKASSSFSGGTADQFRQLDTGVIAISDATLIQIHNSKDGGLGDYVRITGVRIELSGVADHAGTRYSTDGALNFLPAVNVGLMDLDSGSMDVRFGQRTLAAKNEQVKRAPLAGQGFFFNADQGDTAGQYAKALRKFGRGNNDDYLLAPDGGSVGLYKIISNVRTDITPNDGANDGFVIGPGSLAMSNVDNDWIWMLGDFGGSKKLAYSDDIGATWNFNSDPSANATWIDVNPRSTTQVYITDGGNILYGEDGGVNFTTLIGPAANLKGIAIL